VTRPASTSSFSGSCLHCWLARCVELNHLVTDATGWLPRPCLLRAHGFGSLIEAVRQVRGDSTCQVEGVDLSLYVAGPGFAPGSAVLFGRA
jgi:hypothetical protein